MAILEYASIIHRQRLKTGLSQEELASRIGTSETRIQKWEAGETLPNLMQVPLLCAALHLSYDDFFLSSRQDKAQTASQEPDSANVSDFIFAGHVQCHNAVLPPTEKTVCSGFCRALFCIRNTCSEMGGRKIYTKTGYHPSHMQCFRNQNMAVFRIISKSKCSSTAPITVLLHLLFMVFYNFVSS